MSWAIFFYGQVIKFNLRYGIFVLRILWEFRGKDFNALGDWHDLKLVVVQFLLFSFSENNTKSFGPKKWEEILYLFCYRGKPKMPLLW